MIKMTEKIILFIQAIHLKSTLQKVIGCLLVTVLVVSTFSVPAYAATYTLPSGLATSDIEQSVDSYVAEHADTTASMSVAVFDDTNTIFSKAYGSADIEDNVAANTDTVYDWGSVSKLLVWVSAMQLVEQGKLDLNTDIRDYLPAGFLTKLSFDTPITFLNLMNHNAGWQDLIMNMDASSPKTVVSLEKALKTCEPIQLYEPGTVCAYSNYGAALAGYIVERISGQPFYEYVQENIFSPLGMNHTALEPLLSENAWVAQQRTKVKGYSSAVEPMDRHYINLYPCGSACGTLSDMELFAQALLTNEGSSPLFQKSSTLEELFTPTLYYGDTDIARIDHGFWTLQLGVPTIGHGGNTFGFSSYLLLNRKSGTGVVVMTNQDKETIYTSKMMELFFGAYDPAVSGVNLSDISDATGWYSCARTVDSGCARLYGMFNLVHLSQINADTLENMLGNSMYTYSDIDGIKKFSTLYTDYLMVDSSRVLCNIALLIALVIATLYSTLVLLIGFIRFVVARICKKELLRRPFRKYNYLCCACIVTLPLVIGSMVIRMMSLTGAMANSQVVPYLVCFSAMAVLMAAYVVLLIIKFRKLDCTKREKVMYVVTTVATLIMIANIIVWQWYKL
jgi:CubicO group peptidase (beta-lactamase class C family)